MLTANEFLTSVCPQSYAPGTFRLRCDCEDGWIWRPRRGANDPDGYYEPCEVPGCEGGWITQLCDWPACQDDACEEVNGQVFCALHARAELEATIKGY